VVLVIRFRRERVDGLGICLVSHAATGVPAAATPHAAPTALVASSYPATGHAQATASYTMLRNNVVHPTPAASGRKREF
jgi:hypothetical protein